MDTPRNTEMKFIQLIRELMESARKTKKAAEAVIIDVRVNGGLSLPCGCFIACKSADMQYIIDQTNPKELIRTIYCIGENHDCPKFNQLTTQSKGV